MPGNNPVQQTQQNQQANQQQAQAYLKSSLGEALAGEKALPMDPAMSWSIAGPPSKITGGTMGSFRPSTGAPAGGAAASERSLNKALKGFDKGLT